jgi:hypothetical protein
MDINDTKNAQKSDNIFYCNICDCSFSKMRIDHLSVHIVIVHINIILVCGDI